MRMDRDGTQGVAKRAGALARPQDRGRRWRQWQRVARKWDSGVVQRGHMPQTCKLRRCEHALARGGQRIALPAQDSPRVEAQPTVSTSGAALHQAILRAAGTQLRGDPLTHAPGRTHDAHIDEEQGAMLDFEATDQLLVLDLRGIQRRKTRLALT